MLFLGKLSLTLTDIFMPKQTIKTLKDKSEKKKEKETDQLFYLSSFKQGSGTLFYSENRSFWTISELLLYPTNIFIKFIKIDT